MRPFRAPFGIYEGAYGTRNPVFTLPGNTVVGPVDIAVGRMGWQDPVTGEVSNSQTAGAMGIIQPRPGLWALTYLQPNPPGPPVRMLRAGKNCTLITCADIYVRMPLGALYGAQVYTDPTTGILYGTNTLGYVATRWKVAENIAPNCLGIISPYQFQA